MWQCALQDNGIGIPREYGEKLFILFERLHQRDTCPGTRLRLALCTRIIERHGGRIRVESEGRKGSTFYSTLPAVDHSSIVSLKRWRAALLLPSA